MSITANPGQQVFKLRARDSGGTVYTWTSDSATLRDAPVGGLTGLLVVGRWFLPQVSSGRILPDEKDICVWLLNEASGGPYKNSATSLKSSGSAWDLKYVDGTAGAQVYSVFDYGYFINGNDGTGANAPSRLRTDPGVMELTAPFTVSFWVMCRNATKLTGNALTTGCILLKVRNAAGTANWTAPTTSIGFTMPSAGAWNAALAVGGATTTLSPSSTLYGLQTGIWNHIGLTYDGKTATAWWNGISAATASLTGAIDYGAHTGPWVVGEDYATGGTGGFSSSAPVNVHDVRFANVARDAAYFAAIYASGAGQAYTTTQTFP